MSDYKDGFGGAFGVQKDRVDKSAVGWEHHEKVDKHESQRGNAEMQKMMDQDDSEQGNNWGNWLTQI